MARNYTILTIKTLFGQAQSCAYPGCNEPLIFEDKDVSTVVAQIAHIRSERSGGPRHDASYTGDINGDENLILLCGKHHPPVDRHESLYPIEELSRWKERQVSSRGSGTQISADDAKRYTGLSQEEVRAMTELARRASRVRRACEHARDSLNQIEHDRRRALEVMRSQFGPVYAVNDDGSDVLNADGTKQNLTGTIEMSQRDAAAWQERLAASLRSEQPTLWVAVDTLDEEVNVLRMMDLPLGEAANKVLLMAEGAVQHIGLEAVMELSLANMNGALRDLWLLANPDG